MNETERRNRLTEPTDETEGAYNKDKGRVTTCADDTPWRPTAQVMRGLASTRRFEMIRLFLSPKQVARSSDYEYSSHHPHIILILRKRIISISIIIPFHTSLQTSFTLPPNLLHASLQTSLTPPDAGEDGPMPAGNAPRRRYWLASRRRKRVGTVTVAEAGPDR